jgi:hypothetical protein
MWTIISQKRVLTTTRSWNKCSRDQSNEANYSDILCDCNFMFCRGDEALFRNVGTASFVAGVLGAHQRFMVEEWLNTTTRSALSKLREAITTRSCGS